MPGVHQNHLTSDGVRSQGHWLHQLRYRLPAMLRCNLAVRYLLLALPVLSPSPASENSAPAPLVWQPRCSCPYGYKAQLVVQQAIPVRMSWRWAALTPSSAGSRRRGRRRPRTASG